MNQVIGRMLVLVGIAALLTVGCGQSAQTDTQQGTDLSQAAQTMQSGLQQAATGADEAAQQAKAEAEKAAEQARIEAEKAAQQAKAEAEAKAAKITELLAQARNLLDSGELQAAIEKAQVVLSQYDPDSTVAQNIINTAKAELKKLAEKKAATVQQDVQEGVQGVLGGIGE